MRACLLVTLVAMLFVLVCPTLAQAPQNPVPGLLAKLKNPAPSVRESAVKALEQYAGMPEVVDAMLLATKDTAPAVRKLAARNLGMAGDPRAVDPLAALLRDTNPNIRSAAIDALVEIDDTRAVPPLLARLPAEEDELLDTLVRALGSLGGPEAQGALLKIATEADHPCRGTAIDGLTLLQDARVLEIILPDLRTGDSDTLYNEVHAAGLFGDPRAVAPLLGLLAKKQAQVGKGTLIEALGRIGDPRAVAPLLVLATAREGEDDCRVEAIQALGQLGDPRAVPALVGITKQTAPEAHELVLQAVDALGRLRDPAVLPALAPLTKSKEDDVAVTAVLALGRTRDAAAFDAIAAVAKNAKHPGATTALYALAMIPDPRSVSTVVTALNAAQEFSWSGWSMDDLAYELATNPRASADDLSALMKCNHLSFHLDEAVVQLARRDDPQALKVTLAYLAQDRFSDLDPRLIAAVQAHRAAAAPRVRDALELVKDMDKGPLVRLLGYVGDATDVPKLLPLVNEFWTREAAIDALVALKAPQAPALLLEIAKTGQSTEARAAAVRGLGLLKVTAAADTLLAIWNEKPTEMNRHLRAAAVASLAHLGDPRARQPALGLLNNSDDEVKLAGVVALAALPADAASTAALTRELPRVLWGHAGDPQLREVLLRNPAPELTAVLARMLVRHTDDGAAFAELLGQRRDPAAVPALVRAYLQAEETVVTRLAVITALGALGDARGVLACIRALRDPSPDVARAAAAQLKALAKQDFGGDVARWQAWWLQGHAG
jgi:HEAT repeat protein